MQSLAYQNLEKILDETWLKNNLDHTYNKWIMKPADSKERMFLSRFDKYIERVDPLLLSKTTIQNKLRNYQNSQFTDTYYELEVGCYLMDNGFLVDFEWKPDGENGKITPDLFVKKYNVIIEIKTIHLTYQEETGRKSGRVYELEPYKKIKDAILKEIEKYWEMEIKYPLIVIICPDFVGQPLLPNDDFETVLEHLVSRATLFPNGTLHFSPNVERQGLYFKDEGLQCRILSGVGKWTGKGILFYENPNVKENSKIPEGRFLDILKQL